MGIDEGAALSRLGNIGVIEQRPGLLSPNQASIREMRSEGATGLPASDISSAATCRIQSILIVAPMFVWTCVTMPGMGRAIT